MAHSFTSLPITRKVRLPGAGTPPRAGHVVSPQAVPRGSHKQSKVLLFRHSVVSDPLWPHGVQRARLPCLSLSLLTLMSTESVMPSNHLILFALYSSCPQSFPASGENHSFDYTEQGSHTNRGPSGLDTVWMTETLLWWHLREGGALGFEGKV